MSTDALDGNDQLVLWAILRLGKDADPAAIRTTIRSRAEVEISTAVVYSTLRTLQSRRLIRVVTPSGRRATGTGGPRSERYALAPRAARVMASSAERPEPLAKGMSARLRAATFPRRRKR